MIALLLTVLLWFSPHAAQEAAIAMEILDRRECPYTLADPQQFVSDCDMLQKRFDDLRDAPLLCMANVLPNRDLTNDLLMFNRCYKNYLDRCMEIFPDNPELLAARAETEECYKRWDAVRDVRCEYYYTHTRREALKKLRLMLGDEDFAAGRIGPHVPVWRFSDGVTDDNRY